MPPTPSCRRRQPDPGRYHGAGEDNSTFSGLGGAIYAGGSLTFTDGQYAFINNRAGGGLAANNGNSGLCGAIFSSWPLRLSGTAAFADNAAFTFTPADPSSGRGGAIFMDAYAYGYPISFTLSPQADQTIAFRGNSQQSGSNSIYFGNTAGYSSAF